MRSPANGEGGNGAVEDKVRGKVQN